MTKNSISKDIENVENLFENFKKDIKELSKKTTEVSLDYSIEIDNDFDKKMQEIKDEKFKIFVTGEAKSGKSTFINAFLGENILPTDSIQCTSSIIEIKKSRDNKKRLIYKTANNIENTIEEDEEIKVFLNKTVAVEKEYRDIPFNTINDNFLIKYQGQYNEERINNFLKTIERDRPEHLSKEEYEAIIRKYIKNKTWSEIKIKITLEYPLDELKEVTIIDTPGVGAEGSIGEITQSYIEDADAIIFVKSIIGEDVESSSFVNFFKKNIRDIQKETVFLVFTRKNLEEEDKIENAKDRIKQVYKELYEKQNIYILDSLTELHRRDYEKFGTSEELLEHFKNILLNKKESTISGEYILFTLNSNKELEIFNEKMLEWSDFDKFRNRIADFISKAYYYKLQQFLINLKKKSETKITMLRNILNECRESEEKNNKNFKEKLENIILSIEEQKNKVERLKNIIKQEIPKIVEDFLGVDDNSIINKTSVELAENFLKKIKNISYVYEEQYKDEIKKEIKNSIDNFQKKFKEVFEIFNKEANQRIIDLNKGIKIEELNNYLPELNPEKLDVTFKDADKNSLKYKDLPWYEEFYYWLFGGHPKERDKEEFKRLVIKDLEKDTDKIILNFRENILDNIQKLVEKYRKEVLKNLNIAQRQCESFLELKEKNEKEKEDFKEIIKEKILLTNEIVNVYEKNIEKLSQEEIVISNNILDK
jgi:hypothetical protein